jgi:hypothetical protein
MDYTQLFSGINLTEAVTGVLSNPVLAGGMTVVLGAVIAPVLARTLFKIFGRR